MKTLILAVTLAALSLPASSYAATPQQTLNSVTDVGIDRAKAGKKAQQKVDNLYDQQKSIEAEYRHLVKVTEGIRVYNQVLQHQVDQQQQDIDQLQQGIKDAAQMERQVIPLLDRMVNSLQAFIKLYVPFLTTERNFRVQELQKLIKRADVSTAEKMRRVLQAYQIENDYGRTIEAYRDQIEIDGELIEADFLRIGRVALMYQTINGQNTGAWHQQASRWISRQDHTFQQNLKQGLKIARKQVAPSLLMAPVFNLSDATDQNRGDQ